VPSRLDVSFVFHARFLLNLVYSSREHREQQHQRLHLIYSGLSWGQTRNPEPRAVRPSATSSPLRGAVRASTMVQPRLAPCIRLAFRSHSSRNFSSTRETPLPPSVAHLLGTGPADPSNVVVNGFIRSLRSQKQRAFASIGDGSSLEPLQAILTPEQAKRCETCIYMI
jgi:hypothetical protein